MVPVSADREVSVEVDPDANRADVVVTQRLEIGELFDENGELRLWEDSTGWDGYLREKADAFGGPVYFRVNTRHCDDCWLSKVRVGEQAVRDAVRRHIRDRHAGGAGTFVRRCNPP